MAIVGYMIRVKTQGLRGVAPIREFFAVGVNNKKMAEARLRKVREILDEEVLVGHPIRKSHAEFLGLKKGKVVFWTAIIGD